MKNIIKGQECEIQIGYEFQTVIIPLKIVAVKPDYVVVEYIYPDYWEHKTICVENFDEIDWDSFKEEE